MNVLTSIFTPVLCPAGTGILARARLREHAAPGYRFARQPDGRIIRQPNGEPVQQPIPV